MSKDAADAEEHVYIYRSSRGALGIVRADCVDVAWTKATKQRSVEVLRNMTGESWVLGANGKAVREKDYDRTPEDMVTMVAEAVKPS